MKAAFHPAAINPVQTHHSISIARAWKQFISWATAQQPNRMLWIAISVLGHGTIFTIATIITVMLTGNHFFLIVPTCLAFTIVLAVNLAALPTKFTVPIFFASLLADILIIATAIGLAG